MPELPEVETVVREIRPKLVGRRIRSVCASGRPLRRPWEPSWSARLAGRRVRDVTRRGKWIVIHLERLTLVLHLGMTGQLRVVPADEPSRAHTHLVLNFGREQLRFRDVRRFGSATLFPGPEAAERHFARARLGPEPFGVDTRYWRGRLAGTARALKAALLDQRFVAGVGNIYADEALFEARLHPGRLGLTLSAKEASRLRGAVARVLRRAIRRGGADLGDGVYANGNYQDEFRVYGRTGEGCPRCRAPIERVRLAGRSTHYCPRCQPL